MNHVHAGTRMGIQLWVATIENLPPSLKKSISLEHMVGRIYSLEIPLSLARIMKGGGITEIFLEEIKELVFQGHLGSKICGRALSIRFSLHKRKRQVLKI